MNIDFSQVNLQYLIQVNQLAQHDPVLTTAVTGMSDETALLLSSLTPGDLTQLSLIKSPLLTPHPAPWWWSRVFTALRDGRKEEIKTLLEQMATIL